MISQLDCGDADSLPPGSRHWKSWVGEPYWYDVRGAEQFTALLHHGLRASHRVLDIGCGSLRLGRILIPWLDRGNYWGIDPDWEIIEAGAKEAFGHHSGADVTLARHAMLLKGDDFRAGKGQYFDRIVAYSILTHASDRQVPEFFEAVRDQLKPGGICIATVYHRVNHEFAAEWVYPGVVSRHHSFIARAAEQAGLSAVNIAHPPPWWTFDKQVRGHEWWRFEHA